MGDGRKQPFSDKKDQVDISEADQIIRDAIAEYKPKHVFALFSGGHDSLTATHVAMRHAEVEAAVHIATGTGIPQTFEFVEQTCAAHGWPLKVYRPPADYEPGQPGDTYRAWVLENGFPGGPMHPQAYIRLKERAIAELVREHKVHVRDRIMLITGARKQESERRMGYAEAMRRVKARVWVNPLVNWSADDCGEYMQREGLQRNLVSDLLHISGECLCGCFAKPGELKEIRAWFPDVAARLDQLAAQAKRAGVHYRWGVAEPIQYKQKRRGFNQLGMELCASCWKEEETA